MNGTYLWKRFYQNLWTNGTLLSKKMITLFKDFLNLFFPDLCLACNSHLLNNEKLICFKCLFELPKTQFHKNPNNPVAMLFWGRTKIEMATAFFYFNKGSKYQDMMHKFKYNGYKEIGLVLGEYLGVNITESPFNNIDVIIPVPLHKKKFKKRGYNQSLWISKGLSQVLNKPIKTNILIRAIANTTQTKKSRYERWKNVDNIFTIENNQEIIGKHILLVDDVITTGSTLEACANAILSVENTKVSIATLAVA
ncbi:MAG: ComF family protein [Bacteroidales bacterium]|nr:ComF family protein [Bacteroidales bacterium]